MLGMMHMARGGRMGMARVARATYMTEPPRTAVRIPDCLAPLQLDMMLGREAPDAAVSDADRQKVDDLVKKMYSLDATKEQCEAAVDEYVDSGLYDKHKRMYYQYLEELGQKVQADNLKLNEQISYSHGDPRFAHGHPHEPHPDVGAPLGHSWPFPSGENANHFTVGAVSTALWVSPVVIAFVSVYYFMWRNSA